MDPFFGPSQGLWVQCTDQHLLSLAQYVGASIQYISLLQCYAPSTALVSDTEFVLPQNDIGSCLGLPMYLFVYLSACPSIYMSIYYLHTCLLMSAHIDIDIYIYTYT